MTSSARIVTTLAVLASFAAPVWSADALRPASVLPAIPSAQASTAPAVSLAVSAQEIRAQLSPRRYTTLAAEIGAKVNRLPIREGEGFKQGQLLIAFDCSIQNAQLQKAKASLMAAEKTWQANQRLFELNSIGKLELDSSQAEFAKNKAEVDAMSAVVSKCNVPAPFGGRVAEQKVREQQYVQPGQALLEIIDDSVLELEFLVPSKWLVWLRPGYGMQVRIDETAKEYPAKVRRIGATVDPVSQSVKVVAAIDGSFRELIAGMSGRVTVAAPSGR